jgi:hypothetical protein
MLAWALFAPTMAAAQDDASAPVGAPIVLVLDGADGRLSVARLQRALEAVLGRPILRMADAGAEAASATLTIAFARPHRWLVRFDESGVHPTRTLDVRGPALETLVGLAVDAVGEARASADAAAAPPASPPDALGSPLVHVRGEILDPFAGMPISRIAIAVVGELIDPFAHLGGGVRVITSPEVLDPWR